MPTLMKGHKWLERKDKIRRDKSPVVTYPLYAEIKYDEIRCHIIVVHDSIQFLSYAGKPLANMQQFAEQFLALAAKTELNEFDCGFLVNNNFNDSYRWVRSTNGLPADLIGADTSFILFDLPQVLTEYAARRVTIWEVAVAGGLQVPDFELCYSEDEVGAAFIRARAKGFEGLMLKSKTHRYEPGKRTDGWLKYKPSDDEAGVVIGFTQAMSLAGDPLNRAGSVTVRMPDGSIASPSGIAHQLGLQMWMFKQDFMGRTVEFKFMERDRQGGYRHPIFHRLREATV